MVLGGVDLNGLARIITGLTGPPAGANSEVPMRRRVRRGRVRRRWQRPPSLRRGGAVAIERQAATLHAAVLAARPVWWPGRLACLEVATATTVAAALTGRRVHLVLGARPLPNEAHAWVTTPAGSAVGAYAPDRPWAPVHAVPPLPDNHVNE